MSTLFIDNIPCGNVSETNHDEQSQESLERQKEIQAKVDEIFERKEKKKQQEREFVIAAAAAQRERVELRQIMKRHEKHVPSTPGVRSMRFQPYGALIRKENSVQKSQHAAVETDQETKKVTQICVALDKINFEQ